MSLKTVKCLIWDLDDTLWEGTLLEGGGQRPAAGSEAVLRELDRRGILLSIASRNDHDQAVERLEELGLAEYFLYPQINFGPKSKSVQTIAEKLNIGLESLAFIDDQAFERQEVAAAWPQVLTLTPADLASLPDHPRFQPRFVTSDSARRRQMYQTDQVRQRAQENYDGPNEAFMKSLNLEMTIERAGPDDLTRIMDLTERTHQLNATGLTFDYDDLLALVNSPEHLMLINSLRDRFGEYGKIGLSLVEKKDDQWTLKLLLMSCRVMNRGVGAAMLNIWIRHAARAGRPLYADFVETDRNRIMYVTYRFAGFEELQRDGGRLRLVRPLGDRPDLPPYLSLLCPVPDFIY